MIACDSNNSAPTTNTEQAAGFRVANVATATVLDVANGDATYAQVKEAQWTFWIKTDPSTEISKGDHLLLGKGPQLRHHRDKKLARTFDAVIEIEQVKVVTPEESKRYIYLAPPEKDGVAIGDLYAKRKSLADKPVAIRGRVVKANKNIFDTNWYHLQDGTGGEDTNDLTVTSTIDANVGDVVVARGPLSVDHSLGFGYDYDAILLDAELTIEKATAGSTSESSTNAIPRDLITDTVAEHGATPVTHRETATAKTSPTTNHAPSKKAAPTRDWKEIRKATAAKKPKLDKSPEDLSVLGLEMGASDDEAITAWLKQRGIDCQGRRNVMRKAFTFDCAKGLDAAQFPERDAKTGKLTQLLLSHGDNAPLGLLSLTHRYSIPGDAFDAHQARRADFEEKFGAPSNEKNIERDAFEKAKIGRFATTWNFENIEVSLTLYTIQGTIRVIEQWNLKSDNQRHAQRPDAKPVHGAGIRPTPNPHIRDSEST